MAEKMLKIELAKSLIGRVAKHIATANSLGLKKPGDVTVQPENDATKGKIAQIAFLLKVTEATEKAAPKKAAAPKDAAKPAAKKAAAPKAAKPAAKKEAAPKAAAKPAAKKAAAPKAAAAKKPAAKKTTKKEAQA